MAARRAHVETAVARLLREGNPYPEDSPVVCKLNGLVRPLVEGINAHTVFRKLNVYLEVPKVVLLDEESANAFVIPEKPGFIFVTNGLVKLLTSDELQAIVAHELGHTVKHVLDARDADLPVVTERFGERIFRDPVGVDLAELTDKFGFEKVAAKTEEKWSDRFAAVLLAGIGKNPGLLSRALSTMTTPISLENSPGSETELPSRPSALELFSSHPPSGDRLHLLHRDAVQAEYPSWVNRESAASGKLPLGTTPLSFEGKVVERYLSSGFGLHPDSSPLFKGIVPAPLGRRGSSHVYIPASFSSSDSKAIAPVLLVTLAVAFVFESPVHWSKGRDLEAKRLQIPLRATSALLFNLFSEAPAREVINSVPGRHPTIEEDVELRELFLLAELGRTFTVTNDLASKYPPSFLSNFIRELLHERLFSTNQTYLFSKSLASAIQAKNARQSDISQDLERAMQLPQLLSGSFGNPLRMVRCLINLATKNDVPHTYFSDEDGAILKASQNLLGRIETAGPESLPKTQIQAFLTEMGRKLVAYQYQPTRPELEYESRPAAKMVHTFMNSWQEAAQSSLGEEIVRATKAGVLGSIDEYFKWRDRFVASQDKSPSAIGVFHRGTVVFQLDLAFILHHTDRIEVVREFVEQRTRRGIADKGDSLRAPFIEYPPTSVEMLLGGWPDAAEWLLRHTTSAYSEVGAIRSIRDPVIGKENIHDSWYQQLPKRKLPRRRLNESLDSFLSRLSEIPHRYGEDIWRKILPSAVKEVGDIEKMRLFFEKAFDSTQVHTRFTARLHRDALVALAECAFDAIPGIVSDPVESLKILLAVPRCPRRNISVRRVTDAISSTSSSAWSQELCHLVQLLETEPPAEMIESRIRQRDGSPLLREVEVLLTSPPAWISDRASGLPPHERKDDVRNGRIPVWNLFENDLLDVLKDELQSSFGPELGKELSKTAHGILLTASELRHAALQVERRQRADESKPFVSHSRELIAAHAVIESVRRHRGIADPLTVTFRPLKSNSQMRQQWYRFMGQVEDLCPIPTPLRDEWIVTASEKFKSAGGGLSNRELRETSEICFFPDNRQRFRLDAWTRVRDFYRTRDPDTTRARLVPYLVQTLDLPSVERNRELRAMPEIIGPYRKATAELIEAYTYNIPVPPLLGSRDGQVVDARIEMQTRLLKSFDDLDAVNVLLYTTGVTTTRDYSVEYFERLIGGTFDDLRDGYASLDSTSRQIFIEQIFGGREGLFARNDRAALGALVDHASRFVSERLALSTAQRGMIHELLSASFVSSPFPIPVQVEALSCLFELAQCKELTPEVLGNALIRIGGTLGAPGVRILQQLAIEPDLFSPQLRAVIRTAQHTRESGDLRAPFHVAEISGYGEVTLGRPLGKGSVAEVHTLIRRDESGKQVNRALKLSLPSATFTAELAERALREKIAPIFTRHGYRFGADDVSVLIGRCKDEIRAIRREAELASPALAHEVALSLKGRAEVTDGVAAIHYQQKGISRTVYTLCAGEVASPREGKVFAFDLPLLQGEISPVAKLIEKLERRGIQSPQELKEALMAEGVDIEAIALAEVRLFIGSLLHPDKPTLWEDLHFGNTVMVRGRGEPKHVLLDYGSVQANFSPYWRGWIVRSLMHLTQGNFDELRIDLLEAGVGATRGAKLDASLVQKLDEQIEKARKQRAENPERTPLDQLRSLGELLLFLREGWPHPDELRRTGDALNRLLKERARFLTQESFQELQSTLMPSVLSLMFSGAPGLTRSSEMTAKIESAFSNKQESHDDAMAAASSEVAQQYIADERGIPKGTQVFWFIPSDPDIDESGGWRSGVLQRDAGIGAREIQVRGDSPTGATGSLFQISVHKRNGYFRAERGVDRIVIPFSCFKEYEG